MSIWAEKHSVTQETVDDVSKKWSLDSAADFFADCDPASTDVIDESEETTFQKWSKEMSISKEEADEIYRQRDPARVSDFFADCDHKSVDRNGEW